MEKKIAKRSSHPKWVTMHRKPNTEIKLINGKYYLYGVKSVYNKELKRPKKISLGILGKITQEEGFVPSKKRILEEKSEKTYHQKTVLATEYGLSKWLMDSMAQEGILDDLQKHFPELWQFVVAMVYCRIAHQSPLKNIKFHIENADIQNLMDFSLVLNDQKISDMLFDLGAQSNAIHQFLSPKEGPQSSRTVLMDATDIALASNKIQLSEKGYNSAMNFNPQFVLLYLYDAATLKPLYYRMLPGNIREISAMKNTIKISGLERCVFIADKGFFSEANLQELERLDMSYIIPLKRNNKIIPYDELQNVELTDGYFEYQKRFIFHTQTQKQGDRNLELFLDGKLKEQEKNDYLSRITSLPESFSKPNFNEKMKSMGSIAIMHNTDLSAKEVYLEYKNRGQIEQFFDHLKNTLDASCSHMQREESLNGWMFINHLSMQLIYLLHEKLRTTALNKKQMLNHKYSIQDTLMHLKSIKKIQFSETDYVLTEQNKLTKTLLQKLKVDIT
jgi:Transposase DDE domain